MTNKPERILPQADSQVTEEYLKNVLEAAQRLVDLLSDPQPCLPKWCRSYADAMQELTNFWHD